MTVAAANQLKRELHEAFSAQVVPQPGELIGSDDCCDPKGEAFIRNALAGRPWQSLSIEFIQDHWAYYCYLSPTAYSYYLPALLAAGLSALPSRGSMARTVIWSLVPSFWQLYYRGEDAEFGRRQRLLSVPQLEVIARFLGLAMNECPEWRPLAAQALRWGWNRHSTPALQEALSLYRRWHTPAEYLIIDPVVKQLCDQIRLAFASTPYPGDSNLCGSDQGDEPAEYAMEFRGLTWQQQHFEFLALNGPALSFLSDAGFRFFLPAFLISDLVGCYSGSDPVFHLTNGFLPSEQDEWLEYYQERHRGFSHAERQAIVGYLRRMIDVNDFKPNKIHYALDAYWIPSLAVSD